MDDEARVLGTTELPAGNARSYWLDACEDISCDEFIHNFVDFGTASGAGLLPEPLCSASIQDDSSLNDPCFFRGIDQIFDSIKNGGGLPSCGSNKSSAVPNEQLALALETTGSFGLRNKNYGCKSHAHHVGPTAVTGSNVKHIKSEDRENSLDCKRNTCRYGVEHDSLHGDESYGNGKRARVAEVNIERWGRQRPLNWKRPRDLDDLASCQRDQVRRRDQRHGSSRKDRDCKEAKGYWERDKEKNEMVYRLGSWESDRTDEDKMPLEKGYQNNARIEKKPEEQKETVKLPEEQARQYQLDVLEQAKKKNTIAFLETGAGKTLIAILLMKSVWSEMQRQNKKMLAVFLVPKVPLVYQVISWSKYLHIHFFFQVFPCFLYYLLNLQQAEVIRERTAFQVGHYCGEMGQDFWDARRWQREFETKQVVLTFLIIWVNFLNVANPT